MYFKIGNTKILAGKYWVKEFAKIEINFEYFFASYKSERRFANVVADLQSQDLKIKIKSEFSNILDCEKLSKLLIGIEKIVTQENILVIDQIIEGTSTINLQEFIEEQEDFVQYFW